jgi:hypothetical protein
MNERLTELAERKRLLVARARLHRLELQYGIGELRQSLLQPRSMFAMATSGPARPLLLSLLLMVAGRGRFGPLLRGAVAAFTVFKAVRATLGGAPKR